MTHQSTGRVPPRQDAPSPPLPGARGKAEAAAGLDPEQEIRARAASLAIDIVDLPRLTTPEAAVAALTDVAQLLAAWIRDGARPETPDPGDGGGRRR